MLWSLDENTIPKNLSKSSEFGFGSSYRNRTLENDDYFKSVINDHIQQLEALGIKTQDNFIFHMEDILSEILKKSLRFLPEHRGAIEVDTTDIT